MSRTTRNSQGGKRKSTFSRSFAAMTMIWCMVFYGLAPIIIQAQSGNIAPNAIEIDINANLYQGDGNANILNPGATRDWVKDSLANTDVDPDPNDSVAVGIVPGVSGASGGTGHWNGVRVIDGIAGGDQDIFLTGGKENDTTTWNVGPGSVGSSKYDVTQAYIANNQTDIFFGMERRGNNGTTAFDFEFNQSGTAGGYIPTRTVGDVLLTFEMQGSGGSGSATPHVFSWNGSTYVEQTTLPTGLVTSINNTTITPAPWGYVDSGGGWVLSPNIPRFEFAEAKVPLNILPGVNACGGFAYTQVRTRSSSTANSDLKDATKIFRYSFGGPTAAGTISASCDLNITYNGSSSTDSTGGTSLLSYSWQFQKNSSADGSGSWSNVGSPATGATGTFNATSFGSGKYRAILTVTDSSGGSCTDSITTDAIDAFAAVTASAVKTSASGSALTVLLTGTTNNGTAFQWQRLSGSTWQDISGATGSTLTRSLDNIFTDGTSSAATFTLGSDSYSGSIGSLSLRVVATRGVCSQPSSAVTVKATKAVDP